MPLYLAVAAVQAEGEPVPVPPEPNAPPVPAGRRLVAVVNNGTWQSAQDVSHPETYRRLHRRVDEGVWRDLQLYSVDAERVSAMADGRRATMAGQPIPDPARASRR